MRKFLVTGGMGFIGHNVVRQLMDREELTVIMDNRTNYGVIQQAELDYLMAERQKKLNNHPVYRTDIANTDPVDYVIGRERPSCIIHCASFPRQRVVNSDPARGADVMMRGLINLLESAKRHGVERFVYISSSMVYGDFEDDVLEDTPCTPQGPYGIMKLAGEALVKDYSRTTGMEYAIVRPSAVYGPLDVEDRVVAKFMLQAMRGQTLTVRGAAESLDFTYVEDAAAGIVAAATRIMARNNTYNITKSRSVSLIEAAERIVQLVGRGTIECQDRDQNFPSRGSLNIDRARTILGFDPKIDIDQGFDLYHQWLLNSPYWQCQLQQV